MLDVKQCKDCAVEGIGPLPLTEFYKSSGYCCKRHHVVRTKARYRAGGEVTRAVARASSRAWRKRNPERDKALRKARFDKTTSRGNWLRREYGITLLAFDALALAQGGRCRICQEEFVHVHLNPKQPVVDHDHATERIRGLLCRVCNQGLGLFKDDPIRMAAAITYLKS